MAVVAPGYAAASGDSDVGLLRLGRPAAPSRHAVPVCLPTRELVRRELLPVRYHVVSGWGGRTSGGNAAAPGGPPLPPVSPVLRRMSVPILQNSQCSQRSQFNFTDNMLCAGYLEGGQEGCRGDDGSPLVTLFGSTHFLTGVVGWGRGCSHPGYYGVYANMAEFVDWAEGVMKNPPTTATANERAAEKALGSKSEVSRRQCGGLPAGTAVATVERGTAFLTGMLMSSPSGCDGLVFTKLSRYLSWIRPRLQVAEDHVTTQVHQYPEYR